MIKEKPADIKKRLKSTALYKYIRGKKSRFNKSGRKVKFLVAGTQKGGTTALFNYLKENNQIYMPDRKEIHFFDNEKGYLKNKKEFYHYYFRKCDGEKMPGEATPIYMWWNSSPRRIWSYNKNMKIIILVRDPIERSYSHWNMERERDREKKSFEKAIEIETIRAKKKLPQQDRVHSYLSRSFYSHQIRKIWRFFGKKNVLVEKSSKLKNNPQKVINKVTNFLGVKSMCVGKKEVHKGKYESDIKKSTKKKLGKVFEGDVRSLKNMLEIELSNWL